MAATLLALSGAILLTLAPTTVICLLALLIMLIALAISPHIGPSLLALSLPFYLFPKKLGSMEFSMSELILLTTTAGALIHVFRRRLSGSRITIHDLASPFDLPIALFLAAALLSLSASEVLRVSLRDLRTLILEPLAAFYLTTKLVRGKNDLLKLIFSLLLGAAAASGMGLYQYLFTDYVVAVEGAKRVLGPYLSPNQMGLYLGRSIPIASALAFFVPRMRLPAISIASLLAVALVLTFSVGGWLASMLALLTVTLLWDKRAALIMSICVATFSIASLPLLSLERISSHFTITSGTSFIRLHLWLSSLQMIRDHPILGVGMDNFLYHYRSSYILKAAVAEPNLSHPHNIVLNFWLQLGILGLVAFSWLLLRLARHWLRLWRSSPHPLEKAILAGIAGAGVDFLAHGMVDNSYFLVDLAFHFWFLAGILLTIDKTTSVYQGEGDIRCHAKPVEASPRPPTAIVDMLRTTLDMAIPSWIPVQKHVEGTVISLYSDRVLSPSAQMG